MMRNNAQQALNMRRLARASIESTLEDIRGHSIWRRLRVAWVLRHQPTGGTDTVASCVVFGLEGR